MSPRRDDGAVSVKDPFTLRHLLGDKHNPKQVDFILAPEFEVCFVGGMGGGKSYAACVACIRHAIRFPNAKILIARSTEDELFKNPKPLFFEIVKSKGLLSYFDKDKPKVWDYTERTNYARLTNGSEFFFAGLYGTTSVSAAMDRFKNVEYSLIFIDQMEELEEYFPLYELLLQRTRYSAAPPNERHILGVANDEGDNWIRRRFLTYEPPHTRSSDPLAQRRLVRTISWDNPHLDEGARAQLRQMSPEAQSRYVLAEMNAGNAMLIPKFRKVKPFEVPAHWPRWCGIDPAKSSGVTCAEWVAANPDPEPFDVTFVDDNNNEEPGKIMPNAPHFYQEYWDEGREIETHAEAMIKLSYPYKLQGWSMDHTAWHEAARTRRLGHINIAAFYVKSGIPAQPSSGDEWARVQLFTIMTKRGLTVSTNCKHLIRQAPDYRIAGQWLRTGDGSMRPMKIAAKSKYHSVDAGGYALAMVPTRVNAVTMQGVQAPFLISKAADEDSQRYWKQVLVQLPHQRESRVTSGYDESEFNADITSTEDVEEKFRSEEDELW